MQHPTLHTNNPPRRDREVTFRHPACSSIGDDANHIGAKNSQEHWHVKARGEDDQNVVGLDLEYELADLDCCYPNFTSLGKPARQHVSGEVATMAEGTKAKLGYTFRSSQRLSPRLNLAPPCPFASSPSRRISRMSHIRPSRSTASTLAAPTQRPQTW